MSRLNFRNFSLLFALLISSSLILMQRNIGLTSDGTYIDRCFVKNNDFEPDFIKFWKAHKYNRSANKIYFSIDIGLGTPEPPIDSDEFVLHSFYEKEINKEIDRINNDRIGELLSEVEDGPVPKLSEWKVTIDEEGKVTVNVPTRLVVRSDYFRSLAKEKPASLVYLNCKFEQSQTSTGSVSRPIPSDEQLSAREPRPDDTLWWLLDFSEEAVSPTEVHIFAEVVWNSDYDALRVCFNGTNCQETSATSLDYYWDVTGLASGEHILSIQYRQLSDNGDWGQALLLEIPYQVENTPIQNPYPWLLEFSSAENLPLGYDFHVLVDDSGDFSSFRICFDGINCQETATTELYYSWDTFGWLDGIHQVSVEYRRISDSDWNTALKYETDFYLSEIRGTYAPCGIVENNAGATLTSGSDCIGILDDIGDLMPVHWENRPNLQVCTYGMDAWVYDGTKDNNGNFNGIAKVVADGNCKLVGSNVSSVDLRDSPASALPLPDEPFAIDSNTLVSFSFNDNVIANAGDNGTLLGSAGFTSGVFDSAISVPSGDGSGITLPPIDLGCSFTIDTWIALYPDSNGGRIISQLGGGTNSGSNKLLVSIDNGGRPIWEQWTDTGSVSMTSFVEIPKDGTWHYLNLQYDCVSQTAIMYLDNIETGTLNAAGTMPGGSTTLEFGMGEGIYSCNCMIDETRIRAGIHPPESGNPTSSVMDIFYSNPETGEVTASLAWENTGYEGHKLDWGDGSLFTLQGENGSEQLTHFYPPGTYTTQLEVTGKNNVTRVISDTFVIPSFGCGDVVSSQGIMFYSYINCSTAGSIDRLQLDDSGSYNLADFGLDDSLSSIHIPQDNVMSVRLFKDANWLGESVCITSDIWSLVSVTWPDGSPMNDSISSVEIFYNADCSEIPVTPTPSVTPAPTSTPTSTPTPVPSDFVVYMSTSLGYEAIFKADIDGTGATHIAGDGSGNWKHASKPMVSPDGNLIAYECHNGQRRLCVMGSDGNNKQELYTYVHHTQWTWIGNSTLLFIGTDNIARTIQSDGSNLQTVTGWPSGYRPGGWCTTNNLVVATFNGGNDNVYTLAPDGSNIIQLTTHGGRDAHPDWNRDCTQITFQSDRSGKTEIYIMDANGSNQTQVTFTPGNEVSIYPTFSANGLTLLFSTSRWSSTGGYWEIATMDIDDSNLFNVTNSSAPEQWSDWGP